MTKKYNYLTGVTKVKTKLAIAFSTLGVGAAGIFGAASILGTAHAAGTTTVVTPASMHDWYFYDDQNDSTSTATGSMVNGPATPPLGAGSAQLAVAGTTDGQALAINNYAGTKLSDITNMDYWTYQPAGAQAVALQFDIKYRASDVSYGGRLVFEPYQQPDQGGTVASGWQHWTDLTSGVWWASKTTAAGSNGVCGQATPCTWSSIKSQFPDATISGRLLLKAGSGWNTNTYNTDALTIEVSGNGNTFDFELTEPTVTVTIAKYLDGQLATATSANNTSFPMQSTWVTTNFPSGSGTYGLGPVGFNNPAPYTATTSDMNQGSSYTTNEVLGNTVAAQCTLTGAPYALVGYTTGDSLATAASETPSSTVPSFSNIQSNQYVIVWNKSCHTLTTKDQCMNGGWQTYGSTFKNQGDCVSFVATNGKNQPSGPAKH